MFSILFKKTFQSLYPNLKHGKPVKTSHYPFTIKYHIAKYSSPAVKTTVLTYSFQAEPELVPVDRPGNRHLHMA